MGDLGNKRIMAENIQYYMDLKGKTRSEMCEALGVKYTTFTDWVKGNSYPRIDKIELMANYFGISKSDLVEKKGKTTETTELGAVSSGHDRKLSEAAGIYLSFREDERKKLDTLLMEYHKLNEIDRAEVRGRIAQLIEEILSSEDYSVQEGLKHA